MEGLIKAVATMSRMVVERKVNLDIFVGAI